MSYADYLMNVTLTFQWLEKAVFIARGHIKTHFTVPKRQFIPMTFLQIYFVMLPVWMRASGRAGAAARAVFCGDYLVCGSALLLTIIAFCKNCINHVVTIHKALIEISIQRRDSVNGQGWGLRGQEEQGTRNSE